MTGLAKWSPRRVISACALWLVGAPILGAIGLVLGTAALAALSGKQSIGVTVSLTNLSLAWLFLPPLLLVGTWIWSRRGVRRSTIDDSGSE
jgi:hypothetical protein